MKSDMNGIVCVTIALAAAALLAVPRRWALLPVMLGICCVPFYTGFDLVGFNFTAVRMLIAVGVLRLAIRGEFPTAGANGVDYAILSWAFWLLTSSFFHEDPSASLKFRLGLAYDTLGIYTLTRGICRSVDDVLYACKSIAIAMVPLAVGMLYEKYTNHNVFIYLAGIGDASMVREGNIRAYGPFGHPILAGTAGGVCLSLMAGLWNAHNRLLAGVGIAACLATVFCSASSGPILSAGAGLFAVCMWRYRHRIRSIQLAAITAYIALDLVMEAPAYYLIARVDLAGGSTSWYRARLIESAFEHLSEWWLTGTDITRHWMAVIMPDPNNTDITSHYVQMGVYGGLPLLLLFILILIKGFKGVVQVLNGSAGPKLGAGFLIWTFGSSLFAYAVTSLSVSFFDQSIVFLNVVLGSIGSAWSFSERNKANRQLSISPSIRAARVNAPAPLYPSCR